jgi:Ca2+-binding EF-hand superfamily protein
VKTGNVIEFNTFTRIIMLVLFNQVNPFVDRLYDVFFPRRDHNGEIYFSFEDMLDMCSALSPQCPDTVKAMWAFKIFGK